MSLKGLNLAGKSPLPKPRVVDANDYEARAEGSALYPEDIEYLDNAAKTRVVDKNTPEFKRVVKEETQAADAEIAESDAILNRTPNDSPVVERNISDEDEKLSRLVDDDFPFDDTQLTAIHGLAQHQYGVMIGAAGTGKTTTTKKLVDILRVGLNEIDVSQYWQRGQVSDDDDYEVPERLIPSIVMVSFTGRATQMIKKNFPRDWHGNIMTIHRALGFYPEFYQDFDEDSGQMVNKRKFVPAYDAENLMPWDIIIIDEAGMLGLELWHQLWAATKSTCRIIMIGDINQLPPTHGKPILGFAMSEWPTWELTHVHRQQGANNSIVDNAHRILQGKHPVCDSGLNLSLKSQPKMVEALNYMVKNPDWRFLTIEVDEEHRLASLRIRQVLQLLQGKLYDPNRDVVITPINGYEQTAPGYTLGQAPMNQELVVKLNSANPRYLIDAGREKQNFAVGDKVMATVNDYESGITNGMTGIITSIEEHGAYIGDTNRWGLIDEVNEYLSGLVEDDSDVEFSLEEMVSDSQAGLDELKKREKRDAGPASHIVTVKFGEGEHSFEIAFSSKSQVASLMLAYVATCHKMQGGECPLVFGIVHQANKRPLNREWFYTMVTRASDRCVVFLTRQGRGFALGKQSIKGTTMAQKIRTFQELTKSGLVGPSVRVKIPKAHALIDDADMSGTKELIPYEESKTEIQERQASDGQVQRKGLSALLESRNPPAPTPKPIEREAASRPDPKPEVVRETVFVGEVHVHVHATVEVSDSPEERRVIDGGDLKPHPRESDAGRDGGRESLGHQDDSGIADGRGSGRIGGTQLRSPLKGLLNRPVPQLPAPPKYVSTLGAIQMQHHLEDESAKVLLTHQPWCLDTSMTCTDIEGKVWEQKPKPVIHKQTKPLSIGQLLAKKKG